MADQNPAPPQPGVIQAVNVNVARAPVQDQYVNNEGAPALDAGRAAVEVGLTCFVVFLLMYFTPVFGDLQ
jgi:hypothetical protein